MADSPEEITNVESDTTDSDSSAASVNPVASADSASVAQVAAGEDAPEISAPPVNSGFVHSETETFSDVNKADSETFAYDGDDAEDREVAFTYVSHLDPNRQVDPHGIYLDDIEREKAELVRARQEDREPDFENPPAVCSTPIVPTVVAQKNAIPGVLAPVSHYETFNVGGTVEEVE